MQWDAIPYLVERFGVTDVDRFVDQLVTIRDHQIESERHGERR
jgi:hypothetical protein